MTGPLPVTVRRALDALAGCLDPAPHTVTGTVLAPATGSAGPVDAVRDEGLVSTTATPAAALRFLTVQHTRCWVFALTFVGDADARFTARTGVSVLPDSVSGDTARATQFLLDRADPDPGVCLLGPPRTGGGSAHLLAICAEAAGSPSADPATGVRDGV